MEEALIRKERLLCLNMHNFKALGSHDTNVFFSDGYKCSLFSLLLVSGPAVGGTICQARNSSQIGETTDC